MPRKSKFVLRKTRHGGFRFDLKARNGETIASRRPIRGRRPRSRIKSVRRNAKEAKLRDETRK